MRRIRAFRRSIEPVIYWLFAGSSACLLFKIFVLNGIPAPAAGLVTLGDLTETILRSLLAGTIFYVTVTATKTYADRKRLAPWLVDRLDTIAARHEELLSYLQDAIRAKRLRENDWAAAFASLRTEDLTPEVISLDGTRASWRHYLRTHADFIVDYCGQIGRRASFVEPDIVRAATEMEHCHFVNMIRVLPDHFTSSYNMRGFYAEFVDYAALVGSMVRFRDELIRDYGVPPPEGGIVAFEAVEPDDDDGGAQAGATGARKCGE